ncbi:hypothetical protein [Streptomyces sp. WAC01280]|uniref:hypothetical protein n=1 Tax=Streptomyces sp. WAC01280 TaxID=2487424 RepID=UPI000F78F018|nr:hypothetical protein [Streptomyces sp. WAC01280]RSS50077.1 hypothetical protein EF909_39200 [Streptomyces sp. WAC01280]
MAFRRTISQDELRSKQSDADRERYATDYSASRGGWVKKSEPEQTPGAGNGSKGRLFGKKK